MWRLLGVSTGNFDGLEKLLAYLPTVYIILRSMQLRDYQKKINERIQTEWETNQNVCAVLPTAAGKTVCFSKIAANHEGGVVLIAHRQELVEQMSLALAQWGVRHRIEAPRNVVRFISHRHNIETGGCWQDPSSPVVVAGIRTINARGGQDWHKRISLWIMDECHHILQENEWGRGVALFPGAKGLGVTATPTRSDGKGLGRHADGVFDCLVVGPTMRDLIKRNPPALCDYSIYAPAPPTSLHLEEISVSARTGDYVPKQLSTAVNESTITGDAVEHYQRLASGKRAVVFCVDTVAAVSTCDAFTAAGLKSATISHKTPANLRREIIGRFRNGDIRILTNVDLFGEGFDLPAVEVVVMLRPTQSYGLYVQQFGRALRLFDGKKQGVIIDHVGNVVRHGLPDAPRQWTLDRRDKRKKKTEPDVIPLRVCPTCLMVYKATNLICPYCGKIPEPTECKKPEQVDGDLVLLDPETLAKMRGEIKRIDAEPVFPHDARPEVKGAIRKRHNERREMQDGLRRACRYWLAWHMMRGRSQREAQKAFYFRYGVDLLSAFALGRPEAKQLADRVCIDIGRLGVEYGS